MRKFNSYFALSALIEKVSKEGNNKASAKLVNVFLLRTFSITLLFCIVSQALLGPLVYHTPTALLLMDIGVFFVLSVASFVMSFSRINLTLENYLIVLIYNFVFFYSVVRFYEMVGPVLWTFSFILILISTARLSNVMLGFSTITLAAALIYVRFSNSVNFPVDNTSIIVHLVLFVGVYIMARFIYGINVKRLGLIDKQMNELSAQIAERKKVEEENLRLALYDHMTGLPNRPLFSANLCQAISRAKEEGLQLYVMFIDIDFFKRINDTLGHDIGDEFIKQAGNRINAVLGNGSSICRMGGDEFLVMVLDISEKQVLFLAKRVLDQLSKPFIIGKTQNSITCSIGIAKYPGDGDNVDDLIKCADLAMYKAKQDGRNRFEMYTSVLKEDIMEEMRMINSIRDALTNDEFVLYYQPQIDGSTREIIGYEALIRWNHPEQGGLLPGSFLPAAEKSGLIVPIDEWVIRTACRQNKQWQDAGLPKVPVSVNISVAQVNSKPFYSFICDVLHETNLAPEYLGLEITESTIIYNDRIRSELEQIKALGVKIAIDDFGTGFSAIQYLKKFPVDFIKIPMDFIHGISINEKDESIINVILALAESLKINVIAEGVENESQYGFLRERSCRNIQGFFFSRPMPADKVPEFCAYK